MTDDTLTPVNLGTCTRRFAGSHGPISLGPGIWNKTNELLSDPSTASIAIDIWRRSSDTERTITVNLLLWQNTPNSKPRTLPPSRQNTFEPSQPTNYGTLPSHHSSLKLDTWIVLLVGGAGFLAGVMMTLLFAKL